MLERGSRGLDAAAAVAAAAVLVALTALAFGDEHPGAPAYVLCAVAALGFAVRRDVPEATLAVATAAIAAYAATGQPGGPIYVAAYAAAFNLALLRGPRTWLPWTAAAAVTLVTARAVGYGFSFGVLPVALLLLATPKLAGDAVRHRRLVAERRLTEERLRIAREVHDVVGHGLATIALRAGVADRLADKDPAQVREALKVIRRLSQESLQELGALLGVLRGEGEQAERAPVPGLAALPRLVDGLRAAGMAVELDLDGVGEEVPDVVGAAGYRIVQEALTNVARHAGSGARGHVRLARHDGVVEIEVRDDGRGAPAPVRPGGGLTGMRERVATLGGRFEAGRAEGGGFRVWATLPLGRR